MLMDMPVDDDDPFGLDNLFKMPNTGTILYGIVPILEVSNACWCQCLLSRFVHCRSIDKIELGISVDE